MKRPRRVYKTTGSRYVTTHSRPPQELITPTNWLRHKTDGYRRCVLNNSEGRTYRDHTRNIIQHHFSPELIQLDMCRSLLSSDILSGSEFVIQELSAVFAISLIQQAFERPGFFDLNSDTTRSREMSWVPLQVDSIKTTLFVTLNRCHNDLVMLGQ